MEARVTPEKGHNRTTPKKLAIRLTLTEGMWGRNLLAIDSYPKKSGGTGLSQVSKVATFSQGFSFNKKKVDFASSIDGPKKGKHSIEFLDPSESC